MGARRVMCPTHETQMVDSITCDKLNRGFFHGHDINDFFQFNLGER